MIVESLFAPLTLPEDVSIPAYILQQARQYGKRLAYIDVKTGKSLSFREFCDQVDIVASALSSLGLRQNDVVMIASPNCVEYGVIQHAVCSMGAIMSTCNPVYSEVEMEYQIGDCQPKFLFTQLPILEKIQNATKKHRCVQHTILIDRGLPGYMTYNDLLQQKDVHSEKATFDPKTQIYLLPYSSGTTGRPKGVKLSHYNMLSTLLSMRCTELQIMVPGKEVFVAFIPFSHGYGNLVYLNFSLMLGVTTVILPSFELELFLKSVENYKATILHVVPPVTLALIKEPIVDKYDLSSVKSMTCGGASLSSPASEAVRKRLNINIRQAYGMTELSVAVTITPVGGIKPGSSGVLLPNAIAKVVDPHTGETLGQKQIGELCFKGPCIMQGYLNKPQATAETIDSDGWLHSGDIGYFDEDKYFFIIDRIKELIKYNGLQVPPAELESHLLSHPAVADAAVIGVPDSKAGELPRAYIVIKPGLQVMPNDIHKYLKGRVAPYKALRGGVLFRNVIPKNASGKILRRQLRDEASKERTSRL